MANRKLLRKRKRHSKISIKFFAKAVETVTQTYDYKTGIGAMLIAFFMWGFQPLYWYVVGDADTFFLMACRTVWAAVCCLAILKIQGKLPQLWALLRDRKTLLREMAATVFLMTDWVVYLWAVRNGHIMESSLGYYLEPLACFFFGAVVFREKITWRHFVILAVVIVGIRLSVQGFGGVPYVTIALALCFAFYAAIKKTLTVDSIVSTTAEILIAAPLMLLFILFFRMGDNGMASMTLRLQLLLIGSGIVTGVPMLFYGIGIENLPLITVGICQYLSPTLSIFCGMLLGEAFTKDKLPGFVCIWLGVILYTLNTIWEEKHAKTSEKSLDKPDEE